MGSHDAVRTVNFQKSTGGLMRLFSMGVKLGVEIKFWGLASYLVKWDLHVKTTRLKCGWLDNRRLISTFANHQALTST